MCLAVVDGRAIGMHTATRYGRRRRQEIHGYSVEHTIQDIGEQALIESEGNPQKWKGAKKANISQDYYLRILLKIQFSSRFLGGQLAFPGRWKSI